MARGTTGLAAAWVLSCAPLVLPALWPEIALSFGEAPRWALAALPWIAWLGLPGRSGSGTLVNAALAAPPIAAGLGSELSRGGDPSRLSIQACAAIGMILALAAAADLAARVPARARAYALAWLALVPGAPLLALCLGLGGAPTYGEPADWLVLVARASPLGWIAGRASPSAGEGPVLADALVPVGACLVLLAIAGFGASARRGEGSS
ncbi:MAG: hypothetical protein ACKVXR_04180 [Planctomycetota bacterium]